MVSHTLEGKNPSQPRDPLVTHHRWRVSLVWLVPLVAALIGVSMVIHAWLSIGPQITISFQTAAGLEAGKTLVKYKDVVVGSVSSIALSTDQLHVIATVALDRHAKNFAREDTRFWVVRPRIGAGGISGIDTVLSGAYIGVDTGKSTASRKEFVGLENPPTVITGMPGKTFLLHSDDLGSLDVGSPVYYRRTQVGRVASFQLDDDGGGMSLQIFVDAPFDRFVSKATRFWNASGVEVSLGADGLKLNTQSLATVLAGGIAFATPHGGDLAPAHDHSSFVLAKDQKTAMASQDGIAQYLQMRFEQSLRGLEVNAPVEFFGMNIGRVVSVSIDYDPKKRTFPFIVGAVVYPQRLGRVREKIPVLSGDEQQQTALFLRLMVEQGLRAQARTGNLLTGQLYIALDVVSNAPKVAFDVNAKPLMMPTVGGSLDKLQEELASILGKVEKIPLDSIGHHLNDDLAELDKALKRVDNEVLPEATVTLSEARHTFGRAGDALAEDSPLQQHLDRVLQELELTARSLRALTDLLGRHPEALIRGRRLDSAPIQTPPPSQIKDLQEPPR